MAKTLIYSKIRYVLTIPLLLLATSQRCWADNTTETAVPLDNVTGLVPGASSTPSPQETAVKSQVNSPINLLNPNGSGGSSDLEKKGIYSVGGKLFLDRNVVISKNISASSSTFKGVTTDSITINTGQLGANGIQYTMPSSQASIAGMSLQNDSAGVLSWANPKVVQYVTAQFAQAKTTTSSTFQTTFLTANITPKTSTDLIVVLAVATVNAPAGKVCFVSLFRGTTNRGGTQGIVDASGNGSTDFPMTILFVDAPATTSQVTYTVEIANNDNAATVQLGNTAQNQTILLVELQG